MNILVDAEDGTVTIKTRSSQEEQEARDLFRFVVERTGVKLDGAGVMNTADGKEFVFTAVATELK